ncbi:hypothetical protein CKO15_08700 [Halorhodospira abdelmalekii]|uniref:hypothetical protein n=1 Tax=Halorhodospira abdelmalekii TaxID=421629 RepID=UPI001904635B|nr:hypothetical protein [Halorhodospira abdelmalekii]MBK1735359.1 hypothetical protein [Halorhodospira abdelmalekii]
MNVNETMEGMVREWTDMQQKMWESWLQSVKGVRAPEGMAMGVGAEEWQKQYQRCLEAWEQAVREALEAQVEWTRKWGAQGDGSGVSQSASQGVEEAMKQTQEMMKAWTEAQSKLWNAWFDSVKNMDPSRMAQQWDEEGQRVLKAWQEATQRAQEAMRELSRVATEGPSATDGKGPRASKKS